MTIVAITMALVVVLSLAIVAMFMVGIYVLTEPREDEGRERIPHSWASCDENVLKSIFGSVILRGYFKGDTSLVS